LFYLRFLGNKFKWSKYYEKERRETKTAKADKKGMTGVLNHRARKTAQGGRATLARWGRAMWHGHAPWAAFRSRNSI